MGESSDALVKIFVEIFCAYADGTQFENVNCKIEKWVCGFAIVEYDACAAHAGARTRVGSSFAGTLPICNLQIGPDPARLDGSIRRIGRRIGGVNTMTISTEQAKERAAKAAITRQKTERMKFASYAWMLADRLEGLNKRMPHLFKRQNSVGQNLYKILYQEHVRLGIDDSGRAFGSPESIEEHGSKMDAEIAYIQSKGAFGLKLQKKHMLHLGVEVPTTTSNKVDWKALPASEIEELRAFLSEEQVEELLNAAKAVQEQQEAAKAA